MNWRGKRAIVVGASSGMGAALVALLAKRGADVYAVARREDELRALAKRCSRPGAGRVRIAVHDVTDCEAVPALFQKLTAELGGLDLIIYAAGAMPRIAVDDYNLAKDRQMVEVNYLGAIAWLNEAAARFERLHSGRIVAIGSIAGDRGRRGNPVYCSSKAALAAYMESLYNRLRRYGVGVTTIKPGFVDTAMTKGLPGLFWLISPQRAAQLILAAAERRQHIAYVPARWGFVGLVIRNIPHFLFRYLSI